WRQSTFEHEIALVLTLQAAERGLVTHGYRRGDNAPRAYVPEKLMQGCGLASPHSSAARPAKKKPRNELVIQIAEPALATNHPLIELPDEGQLRARRRRGVPGRGEMLREGVEMGAKDSRSQAPNDVVTVDELIQHFASVLGSRAVAETTARLCRVGKRRI